MALGIHSRGPPSLEGVEIQRAERCCVNGRFFNYQKDEMGDDELLATFLPYSLFNTVVVAT